MKQTLRNIVIGAAIVGAVALSGCKDKYSKVIENTHGDGMRSSYTTLTDIDRDGSFDVAETVETGYTPGSSHKTIKAKRGYLAQSVNGNVEFVSNGYFDQFQ